MSRRANNSRSNTNARNNQGGPGRATASGMIQPRLKPVANFSRTVQERFDISTDGINPTLGSFVFSLDSLPDYQDFTNLFQSYRVTRIKCNWKPEYTELTDAALVSNAVNVNFNTAVDQTNSSSPATVQEIIQYQSCKSTGITKQHQRSFIPTMLMGGVTPCECYISSTNPSERLYCIKYAIPPSGVAMVFRSTVTFFVTCAGAK